MANTIRTLSPGTVLFKENDRSKEMYIIQKGRMSVYKTEKGSKLSICELGKGSIVGEMSLLDGRARSATVEALEETDVSVVTPDDFEKRVREIPEWFLGIIKILCSRLREADRRLRSSLEEEITANTATLLGMLLNKAEKDPKTEHKNRLDLKFAKMEIVDILSLNVEKVNHALKELEKYGIIEVAQNTLAVPDKAHLALFADFRRGLESAVLLSYEGEMTEGKRKAAWSLYGFSKCAKPDKDGFCEVPTDQPGGAVDVIKKEGGFLLDLEEKEVVRLEKTQNEKTKELEFSGIAVNRNRIAVLLALMVFRKNNGGRP